MDLDERQSYKDGAMRILPSMTDRTLATAIGLTLFLALGWPLLFVPIPPYQDLAGHLGVFTILTHPAEYPEYAATGALKTNAAYFALGKWLSPHIGAVTYAKLFSLLVILANALALPHLVLKLRGRAAMIASVPFLVPMVHHWFISTGMHNFSLAIPIALTTIPLLEEQASAPSVKRGAILAFLGVLLWWVHVISLLVVGFLLAIQLLIRRDRWLALRAWLPPFAPALLLMILSAVTHVESLKSEAPIPNEWTPPLQALFNLWEHYLFGPTRSSLVLMPLVLVLIYFAVRGFREPLGILGRAGFLGLILLYAVMPDTALGNGCLQERVLPFVWACALLRLPAAWPRPFVVAFGAIAVIYVGLLNRDLFRLSNDLENYASATAALPMNARLLPLTIRPYRTSVYTASLDSASSIYVLRRHTTALDVWSGNASMPLINVHPESPKFGKMAVRQFVEDAPSAGAFCKSHPGEHCRDEWQARWHGLWTDAEASYDFVLLYGASPELLALHTDHWRNRFANGDVQLFERTR